MVKQIVFLAGVMLLILSFTSCSSGKNVSDLNTIINATGIEQTNSKINTTKDNNKTDTGSDLENGVIAKSDNAVSSGDKEEVIKKLDKELDSLFNSINDSNDIGQN